MVRRVTEDDIGIRVLREAPVDTPATNIIDIVAIHGIGAHPDDSWCKNVGTTEDPRWVNWLDNEAMLPAVATQARILRYGYESQWFGLEAMRQNVTTVANRFLIALQRKREECLYRPIIFIAHCFGGLVVLKALLEAQHDDNDLRGIFASTTGLIFFGTPFRGAEGMSQMEMLEAARRQYQEDEIHPDVLNVLEPGNEFLQELVDRFGKTRRLENKAQIACFYELKPSNVGKIVGGLDRRRFVVSESSGSLDVADGTSKFSLSRTHFNMNKFGKATEEDFETVIYVIKKMIEASHGLTLARSSSPSPLVTRPLKPVPQSDSLFPTKNYRNFRLRGIPVECQSRADVRDLVKRILSINFGASFVVHSLASNPLEIYSKIATLSFQTIPDSLSSAHTNEWAFSLPPDLNSDNDRLSQKRSLVFDTHFSGFTPLQHMEDEGCKIDIVALSGPGGHAFGSFQEKEGSFMWLRDALPLDIPNARILIYGYDTDLAEVSSFQNFSDLAKTFEIDVQSIRQINPKRPIVFFGHSLGGLVIKEALVNNKASTEETSASILNFTAALFYFGVPHLGMSAEALISLMKNVPNSSIFEHLKKDSFPLQQLERDFIAAVGTRSPRIISFFELEKSITAIKGNNGAWKLSGPLEILVEPSSATCGSKHQHPINRNHAELVRYGNQYDAIYGRSRVSLLSIVDKESKRIDGNREAGENLLLPLSDANLDCLKSLGFRDQENRFNGIHSAKNTCEWLLEDPQYRHWMNEPRGLFWIKGNPGAGKSVLMKFAVMRMNHENPGAIVLSFFLHGRGKILQKTPLGLFRALLNSMLKYFPRYLSDLTKLFEDREKRFGSFLENRWDWAEKELQEFMLKVLTHGTRNRPVIIFVDALDECGKDVAKGLLTYFKDIMEEFESNGAQVKICFSSRHYPILGHGTIPGISVEERNDKDIRSVIQRKFKEIEPEVRRRQLEKDILLKAQGGFQWAVLVADMIADENATGTKAEKLIEKLASTPEDLEELYTEILSNATDAEKEQMVKLAQWILFSERPLSVQELRDALATDKEMTYTTVSELRSHEVWIQPPAQFERHVTHISRGLVEFQTREVWEQYEPGEEEPDREAQFIHQSVADHMLNKFLDHLDCVGGNPSRIGAGHFQISRSCFKYLTLKDVLEGDSLSRGKFSVKFPLAPYAVRFLFDHIRQVEQAGVSQIDLLSLIPWESDLVSMKKFASIWRKLDPDTSHAPIGWPFVGATVLHILVAFGSKTAFDASIEHYDGDMNGRDSRGYTPLLLAIRERHNDLALSLLDWSMNEKEHHRKSTPQDILMNDDNIKISRFVDVNTKNDEGETPLTVALTELAGDVIFKLIESDVELEYFGGKPDLLRYTICQRDEKLLKKLIEKKLSLDGGVYFAVKELSRAEDKVLESFISRLLEAGGDTIKLQDLDKTVEQGNRSESEDESDDESDFALDDQALILASRQGQTKIVDLLLSHGASSIYRNVRGEFPLMEAVMECHEKLVETLLQADPSAATMQDEDGETALHYAVENEFYEIAKILIREVPAAVKIKNHRKRTPLHQAVMGGHEELVEMMIQGEPSAVSIEYGDKSFLYLALKHRHEKIAERLIEKGVPVMTLVHEGPRLLYLAIQRGYKNVAISLMQVGPSAPTFQDDAGDTSLHIAVKHGHKNIVEMLIQKVPSATNIANNRDETPLHSAVRSKNIEIISMLLYGDVSALDMMNSRRQTPLELAVIGGNRAIVELLLMHVVDIDSKTLNKSPWLIQAAIEGNHHMIEVLQNRGLVSTEFEHMYRPLLQLKTGNIVHFEVIKRLVIINWTMDYIDNTHHDFVQVQLFEAAKLGHELIIRVIIYISCIDFALPLKDKNGQTLLSLAAENGHEAIVKLLLGIGNADPDSRDSDGNTPLSRAASNGHLAIVKLLLDTGKIDVDTKDPHGWTPIMWALSVENMDLATILQSYSRERTYHLLPRPT